MAKFNPGDKVVWSHAHGAVHGDGSIIKKSAVTDPDAKFGEVVSAANSGNTWFDVALEGGGIRTLTGDELVRVSPEE